MSSDNNDKEKAVTLPPPQPTYVLRGHRAQVHSVHFLRGNSRLLTGDADGWVVLWNLAIKRPVAVWRAHDGVILGFEVWGEDNIISHGRDNSLKAWQLGCTHEDGLSTILPVNDTNSHRKQPWMLHSLSVNTLNFCSFSMTRASTDASQTSATSTPSVLIAVPAVQDERVDVFQLPSERRTSTVPAVRAAKTGMVMALKIFCDQSSVHVAAGYESGHTALHSKHSIDNDDATWQQIYLSRPHSQPVLSLDVALTLGCYYTSSADSIVAKHPLPSQSGVSTPEIGHAPLRFSDTKHSGQQSLRVRSDMKILATAGWDARVRVYSAKTLRELAVLKWHIEGCYAVGFAEVAKNVLSANKESKVSSSLDAEGKEATVTAQVKEVIKTVRETREEKTRATHWLAVGSKDGKVSLWNIY